MNILLYNPDNEVTNNYMPHLWMFVLQENRLTRPRHWLDFRPFRMAFTPLNITVEQAEHEVHEAWRRSYEPEAIAKALRKIEDRPFQERVVMFFAWLIFRGIYFPQLTKRQWLGLLWSNRASLMRILKEAYRAYRGNEKHDLPQVTVPVPETSVAVQRRLVPTRALASSSGSAS